MEIQILNWTFRFYEMGPFRDKLISHWAEFYNKNKSGRKWNLKYKLSFGKFWTLDIIINL